MLKPVRVSCELVSSESKPLNGMVALAGLTDGRLGAGPARSRGASNPPLRASYRCVLSARQPRQPRPKATPGPRRGRVQAAGPAPQLHSSARRVEIPQKRRLLLTVSYLAAEAGQAADGVGDAGRHWQGTGSGFRAARGSGKVIKKGLVFFLVFGVVRLRV